MTQHVFDTSYLIGMDSVKELEQCPNAIIPSAVLKELDKHKSRPDNVGAAVVVLTAVTKQSPPTVLSPLNDGNVAAVV